MATETRKCLYSHGDDNRNGRNKPSQQRPAQNNIDESQSEEPKKERYEAGLTSTVRSVRLEHIQVPPT